MNNITHFVGKLQARDASEHVTDPCNPALEGAESYRLTLRIVSIFVLLVVSFLGASLAVLSARVKRCRIPPVVLNIGKFFGIG